MQKVNFTWTVQKLRIYFAHVDIKISDFVNANFLINFLWKKEFMKRKLIFILLILFIILILILLKVEYKNRNLGNNISKSDNTDILNISSYEATVEIQVNSNKNTNKYIINQKYLKPDIFSQEVIEPNNLKGLKIICEGSNVTLQNKKLELKTVYENFNGNVSNLSLISIINEYKQGTESQISENQDDIIMKTKISQSKNKYQMYQYLYISKSTKLPTKMEILDINKNVTVYILYNEIKLNKINKNDILGN